MYPDCALLFCISSRKRKKCPEFLPTVIPFLKNKIKYTRWRHREYPAHDLYHPTSHFLYCWSNENASLPLTEFLYSLHACLFRKCMHFSLDFHSSEANYYLWLMFVPTTLLFNWTFGLCLDSNASTFWVLYSKWSVHRFSKPESHSDIKWYRLGGAHPAACSQSIAYLFYHLPVIKAHCHSWPQICAISLPARNIN